jgi:hypothetical protein
MDRRLIRRLGAPMSGKDGPIKRSPRPRGEVTMLTILIIIIVLLLLFGGFGYSRRGRL